MVLITTLLSTPCVAGRLDDFESGLEKPKASQPQYGREAQSTDKGFLGGLIEEVFIKPFSETIVDFFQVIFGSSAQASFLLQEQHLEGDARLPVLQVELFTQQVDPDLYALDLRSQLGYGPYLIMTQVSGYQERHPRDALVAARWGVGGRYTYGDYLQSQVLVGALQFSKNNVTTRAWLATPVSIMLGRYAFEYRPTFADGVTEHDIAVHYNRRFWSAELGYRALSNASATLEGPYLGIGMHW